MKVSYIRFGDNYYILIIMNCYNIFNRNKTYDLRTFNF